ncbi:MAG: HNH endonuclease [Clostridia bacterium]|nr:HNH endonuclease [Clostridia bacterium]
MCQTCGRPAEEVHHKVSLTAENINDSNISLNPDNLVSLCRDCHFAVHREQAEGDYTFDSNGMIIPRVPAAGASV